VGGRPPGLPSFDSEHPVRPANPSSPSYTFGPAHQQYYPDPMVARGSRGEVTYLRTGASNEGACSQVRLLPELCPGPWAGASVGQPAMGGITPPAFGPGYSTQPANAPDPPYAFGPAHQPYPGPMTPSSSQYQGHSVVQDVLGGPYYQPR